MPANRWKKEEMETLAYLYHEGASYGEIAEELHMSRTRVGSKIQQMKKKGILEDLPPPLSWAGMLSGMERMARGALGGEGLRGGYLEFTVRGETYLLSLTQMKDPLMETETPEEKGRSAKLALNSE